MSSITPVHKATGNSVFATTRDRWLRNFLRKNEGDNYEDRSDRRQWPHRTKACHQVSCVGAGLLARSLMQLNAVDTGFNPANLLAVVTCRTTPDSPNPRSPVPIRSWQQSV